MSCSAAAGLPNGLTGSSQHTAFQEKYVEEHYLGIGGFGSVCAGHRKEDLLPIAVKHIPLRKVTWTTESLNRKQQELPLEAVPNMAPEWFLANEVHAESSTVWQLGVIMHQVLCVHLPFCNPLDIMHKKLTVRRELSTECQDLLHCCLDEQPQARSTLEEMLQHSWLQQ
ncbi:hypothetical protein MATL_G00191990 [Megalops atlanticus]|uniref:non-specific serine/threonine protein kinase n=1 Tax=Megalops atlanticus TaxID=7932 RepID=A0A9D3PNL5_MEGAT|nr:hypothetical protein MATL_G00191990 [Megalops atlanticus]